MSPDAATAARRAQGGDGEGVELSLLDYRIVVRPGALARLGELVASAAPAHRYAIITDDIVAQVYAARAAESLGSGRSTTYIVPSGEAHKTRDTWASLTDRMLADGHGRDTVVIALGGGVIGDLAGFVAATYMRGIPVVQVPTTLLAMVDASVGGKTAVDTPAGKNLVGAFHQPAIVVADPEVLETLPPGHVRAGLAEALKHGVIADIAHFDRVVADGERLLKGDLALAELTTLIADSAAIKARIVAGDVREGGLRKVLNFGHTLGHAIEAESGYRLLHGEAVSMGMVLEARLAERMDVAERTTAKRVWEALVRLGLPIVLPDQMKTDALLAGTRSDKKVRAGAVEYALPARIGAMAGARSGWSIAVPDDEVRTVLDSHPRGEAS